MSDWETTSSNEIYRNPWISLRQDEVVNHNGKPLTYTVVDVNSPSVYIAAMNEKQELLIQREYRYTIDQEIWSVPAGHSDGENLLDAAKRELLEETGLVSDDWQELGRLYSLPGIANAPGTVFMARDVRQESDERDPDEAITQQLFKTFDQLDAMIASGEINSTTAIGAICMARVHTLRNRHD